jgi:sulfur transfer protein SufE
MNKAKLATAIRDASTAMFSGDADTHDVSELLNVLARVIEGKTLEAAFGAPGDWGYETPIGSALSEHPG